MTRQQTAYLAASITIALATVLTAAGSWAELATVHGTGALLLNVSTVIANYFAPKPSNGKGHK